MSESASAINRRELEEAGVQPHDHNGMYIRREVCELRRENDKLEMKALINDITLTKHLTIAVLSFQFATLGGLLLKWALE